MRRRREDGGQAAVEVALVLPVVAVLLLAVVQMGFVMRDQVLVVHSAREGAREAAVSSRPDAAWRGVTAGSDIDRTRLQVTTSRPPRADGRVRVTVVYRAATDVPLVGAMLPDISLQASASMRRE